MTGYLWRGDPGLEVLNTAILAARTPRTQAGQGAHPCGTIAAYKRHRRHGEPACGPCLEAHREHDRAVRRGLVTPA